MSSVPSQRVPVSGAPEACRRAAPVLAVIGLCVWLDAAAVAQPAGSGNVPGGFTVPVYEKGSSRMAALLRGVGQFDLRTSRQLLETVQVEYYDERGQTNLILSGTNCVYDFRSGTASSPRALRVLTGDRRLDLRGLGFFWWQTNNDLAISNDVTTVVHKRAHAPPGPGPEDLLEVRAQQFRFLYGSNLIIYTGNVRVTDPRFELTCARLTIRRSPSNSVERVVAEDHVIVSNRLDHSLTTAAQATYLFQGDQERLELTGHPVWSDGVREGQAERFLLDRHENTLLAVGDAHLRLPRNRETGMALLGSPAPTSSGDAGSTTAVRFLEVAAGALTLQFPPTNGPVRRVTAETNVLILDRADHSQATAARAVLDEDSVLTLSGSPTWSAGEREIRAGLLSYDARQQHFAARTNVVVRFPVLALGQSLESLAGAFRRTNALPATNQWVEIHSEELLYREAWLRFAPAVRAVYRGGTQALGSLTCAVLALKYSNRLEQLEASGGFLLEQEPTVRADGTRVAKRFQGDTLGLTFRTNGTLERLAADGQVQAVVSEYRPKAAQPVEKRLECGTLSVVFRGGSNFVEHAFAEPHVLLRQGDRQAEADRARYSDSTGFLTLSGHPVVTLPEGRITDAATLVWERATGKYRVTGQFRSHWKHLPLATNVANLLRTR